MTHQSILIEQLKKRWITNYQAIEIVKSGCAGRRIREIRKKPPIGWKMIQREKPFHHVPFFNEKNKHCLEYRLLKDEI